VRRRDGGNASVREEYFIRAASGYFEPRRSCSKFMEVLAVFDASSRRLLLPK
jgi:hypothetical protein